MHKGTPRVKKRCTTRQEAQSINKSEAHHLNACCIQFLPKFESGAQLDTFENNVTQLVLLMDAKGTYSIKNAIQKYGERCVQYKISLGFQKYLNWDIVENKPLSKSTSYLSPGQTKETMAHTFLLEQGYSTIHKIIQKMSRRLAKDSNNLVPLMQQFSRDLTMWWPCDDYNTSTLLTNIRRSIVETMIDNVGWDLTNERVVFKDRFTRPNARKLFECVCDTNDKPHICQLGVSQLYQRCMMQEKKPIFSLTVDSTESSEAESLDTSSPPRPLCNELEALQPKEVTKQDIEKHVEPKRMHLPPKEADHATRMRANREEPAKAYATLNVSRVAKTSQFIFVEWNSNLEPSISTPWSSGV